MIDTVEFLPIGENEERQETAAARSGSADPQAFTIDDDAKANWYLRHLANIEAEKNRVMAQAEKILKEMDADAERLRFLFGAQMEHYCRAKLLQSGGRRKSVTFLQGTCAFRHVPASVKVADVGAALDFARNDLTSVVRHVQTLDAAGYRDLATKHLQETGELLPGLEIAPAREAFKVTFGKSE